jgi:hypothetical protein
MALCSVGLARHPKLRDVGRSSYALCASEDASSASAQRRMVPEVVPAASN